MNINFFKNLSNDERIKYLEERVDILTNIFKEIRDENRIKIGDPPAHLCLGDRRPSATTSEVIRLILNHLDLELEQEPETRAENRLVSTKKGRRG